VISSYALSANSTHSSNRGTRLRQLVGLYRIDFSVRYFDVLDKFINMHDAFESG